MSSSSSSSSSVAADSAAVADAISSSSDDNVVAVRRYDDGNNTFSSSSDTNTNTVATATATATATTTATIFCNKEYTIDWDHRDKQKYPNPINLSFSSFLQRREEEETETSSSSSSSVVVVEKLSIQNCPHPSIPVETLFESSSSSYYYYFTQLKVLSIDHCDYITTLPSSIGCLVNLESLIINSTSITNLPDEIGNLSKLNLLHLDNNEYLSELPTTITKCSSLQRFDLINYHYQTLPEMLFAVVSLTEIHIEFCEELIVIPSKIRQLTNLEYLHIRYCHSLKTIPSEIRYLTNLKGLEIDASQITSMPIIPSIFGGDEKNSSLNMRMNNLHSLTIRSSGLKRPPYGIDKLTNLQFLDLLCDEIGVSSDNNSDESLSSQPSFNGLTKLRHLEINTKKFGGFPSSILQQLTKFHLTTNDTNVIPTLFAEPWSTMKTMKTTTATGINEHDENHRQQPTSKQFDGASSRCCCCCCNLEELDLHICGSSSHFIRLLQNIQPMKSLKKFSICKCSIDTYDTFLKVGLPTNLQSLNFINCSHLNKEVDRSCLQQLLERHPQLGSISGSIGHAMFSPYMTHLLCLNSCGRVLLLNNHHNHNHHQAQVQGRGRDVSPNDVDIIKKVSIPLSVWPGVLARVRNVTTKICRQHLSRRTKLQREMEASTIYALLHGQALLCRSEAPPGLDDVKDDRVDEQQQHHQQQQQQKQLQKPAAMTIVSRKRKLIE